MFVGLVKGGGHWQQGWGSEWARWAPVVKAVDNPGVLHIANPKAIKIHRHFYEYQVDVARRLGAKALAEMIIDSCPWRDPEDRLFYEYPFNEELSQAGEELQEHLEIIREGIEVFERRHCRAIILNLPHGNPKDYVAGYAQLVKANWSGIDRRRHLVGLHAYWGNQGFSRWRALRHRLLHDCTSGDHPAIILTEAGRDKVIEEGAYAAGWKLQGVSAETYWGECKAFDQELVKDPYILGWCLFDLGAFPPFEPFECADRILPLYLKELGGRTPAFYPNLPEEEPMALHVAIFPSNQSYNRSTVKPYDQYYNEKGGMDQLALALERELKLRGVDAKAFIGAADQPNSTINLQAQLREGYGWLKPLVGTKMGVSLHSDSGKNGVGFSHTYGIYGRHPRAKDLAETLTERIQQILGTATTAIFQKLGTTDYLTYLFNTLAPDDVIAILEECFCHEDAGDMASVWAKLPILAAGMADAIVETSREITVAVDPRLVELERLLAESKFRESELVAKLRNINRLSAV